MNVKYSVLTLLAVVGIVASLIAAIVNVTHQEPIAVSSSSSSVTSVGVKRTFVSLIISDQLRRVAVERTVDSGGWVTVGDQVPAGKKGMATLLIDEMNDNENPNARVFEVVDSGVGDVVFRSSLIDAEFSYSGDLKHCMSTGEPFLSLEGKAGEKVRSIKYRIVYK